MPTKKIKKTTAKKTTNKKTTTKTVNKKVKAAPKKKSMVMAVAEAWEAEKEFDLERLLKGGNPFKEEE